MQQAAESGTSGVWGAIARQVPERGRLAQALAEELRDGLAILQTLPPAITFFGGSRMPPGDPYYLAATRMGELLAATGIPPRTGAGPGIMSAVPEGFRRALTGGDPGTPPGQETASRVTGRPQALTQGFNIKLPFEQTVNPAIDVSLELVHFPTRKLMLYENALGLVIFPGGFGTLDELFEVWRLKTAHRIRNPFVLFGRAFWEPLLETLRGMTLGGERVTVPEYVFSLVTVTDDPEEAIRLVTQGPARAFDEPPQTMGPRIAHELLEGLDYLERLPCAVTVVGGTRLASDDPAIHVAETFATLLARHEVPTRATGSGILSVALARGGHRGSKLLPQQAFGMRREDARNLYGADRVHLVNDRLTHKVLLVDNSRALVVLPGGLGTLDEFFSILCQLQTGKLEPRPLILVGTRYWKPFLETLRSLMLAGPRQLIAPDDLDLMTVTDDPAEVAHLILARPPGRPAARFGD